MRAYAGARPNRSPTAATARSASAARSGSSGTATELPPYSSWTRTSSPPGRLSTWEAARPPNTKTEVSPTVRTDSTSGWTTQGAARQHWRRRPGPVATTTPIPLAPTRGLTTTVPHCSSASASPDGVVEQRGRDVRQLEVRRGSALSAFHAKTSAPLSSRVRDSTFARPGQELRGTPVVVPRRPHRDERRPPDQSTVGSSQTTQTASTPRRASAAVTRSPRGSPSGRSREGGEKDLRHLSILVRSRPSSR